MENTIEEIKEVIASSESLLITAGAGMGVDSGMPDFRGDKGFWNAYPAFKGKYSFQEMANPIWFQNDPEIAWGFYGHRMNLYNDTQPHHGFQLLKTLADKMPKGYFVFTSNVDGHFQRAGFDDDRILECHGSIQYLQCMTYCEEIWPAGDLRLEVNEHCCALGNLPACPHCNALARPNILMFGDWGWRPARTQQQEYRCRLWLDSIDRSKLVIIECGAGTAVPTVRMFSERTGGTLIRINPREPQVPPGHYSLATGALEALTELLG